jgi:branched-chain amino acid transport system substrate-binding protein
MSPKVSRCTGTRWFRCGRRPSIRQAHSTDAVVDALRHNEFDTVLGRLGFDDKGDVTGVDSFIWYVWSDSGYHPAESE